MDVALRAVGSMLYEPEASLRLFKTDPLLIGP